MKNGATGYISKWLNTRLPVTFYMAQFATYRTILTSRIVDIRAVDHPMKPSA